MITTGGFRTPVQIIDHPSGVSFFRTMRGVDADNYHFSLKRKDNPYCIENYGRLAQIAGVDQANIVGQNGLWPHSGEVIDPDEIELEFDPLTGGVRPLTQDDDTIKFDGIVTRSKLLIPSAQGADCSLMAMSSRNGEVIGTGHGGTKPVIRHLAFNMVAKFVELGVDPADIFVNITVGAGDEYYEYGFSAADQDLFEEFGREDLIGDPYFCPVLTLEAIDKLTLVRGKAPTNPRSFATARLIESDLIEAGVPRNMIMTDRRSSIMETETEHSYRRRTGNNPADEGLGTMIGVRI